MGSQCSVKKNIGKLFRMLSLGVTTGYAINPARDLRPRIVHALYQWKIK